MFATCLTKGSITRQRDLEGCPTTSLILLKMHFRRTLTLFAGSKTKCVVRVMCLRCRGVTSIAPVINYVSKNKGNIISHVTLTSIYKFL